MILTSAYDPFNFDADPDPGSWIRTGKKIDPDPDPGHFCKIYWNFLTKQNFQIFAFIFSFIFILKLDEPFRNEEIFIIFFKSSDLGVKKFFFLSFWLIFYPLDPDPWIRIFLRIRIQEAKILWIQRIRFLSTDFNSTITDGLIPKPKWDE